MASPDNVVGHALELTHPSPRAESAPSASARGEWVHAIDLLRHVPLRIYFSAMLLFSLLAYSVGGGYLLVEDAPERSDVIVALDGGSDIRPELAVNLLERGYGRRVVLDVSNWSQYGTPMPKLAEDWVATLPPDVRSRVQLCIFDGSSTREEALAVSNCLHRIGARSVLLATSDFHTRRAYTIFSHELPQIHFSVAAARDPQEFQPAWWRNREAAKTFLLETTKFLWFEAVDRWR